MNNDITQERPRCGRFEVTALFASLDAQRLEWGLTWRQVAKGGRVGAEEILAMARWLGRPVATLTRRFQDEGGVKSDELVPD